MSKNLVEIVRLKSEEKKSVHERSEKRDYEGLQRAGIAHPNWPTH